MPAVKSVDKFINFSGDTAIPLPKIAELKRLTKKYAPREDALLVQPDPKDPKPSDLYKHEKAFDDFCRWSSVPKGNRRPESEAEFERKYGLAAHHCYNIFKKRKDFQERCFKYMFEWIRELYPEFIHKMYLAAVKDKNASAIKFFSEMVAQDLTAGKPAPAAQPLMIVGVPQEKIDRLFIPDEVIEPLEEVKDAVV